MALYAEDADCAWSATGMKPSRSSATSAPTALGWALLAGDLTCGGAGGLLGESFLPRSAFRPRLSLPP